LDQSGVHTCEDSDDRSRLKQAATRHFVVLWLAVSRESLAACWLLVYPFLPYLLSARDENGADRETRPKAKVRQKAMLGRQAERAEPTTYH